MPRLFEAVEILVSEIAADDILVSEIAADDILVSEVAADVNSVGAPTAQRAALFPDYVRLDCLRSQIGRAHV